MKSLLPGLAMACAAIVMSPVDARQIVPAPIAPAVHTAHDTHVPHVLPAQRWATDAPLREGMGRVRMALSDLARGPAGAMGDARVRQDAAAIKDAVAYMFANCQLPEEPDQALHSILVPLLEAAEKLESDPSDTGQIKAMRATVADYPRYFDDLGWRDS